jgi:hypothetical protein
MEENKSKRNILKTAANKALGSGFSGASAMAIQVTSLMWMRTIMNYQYRNGGTLRAAVKTLYNEVSSKQ